MTKKLGDDSGVKIRMRDFIIGKGLKIAEAERLIGYKRGFFSSGNVIGTDKLELFFNAFPDSDIYYILFGNRSIEGSRLVESNDKIAKLSEENMVANNRIAKLIDENAKIKEENAELRERSKSFDELVERNKTLDKKIQELITTNATLTSMLTKYIN